MYYYTSRPDTFLHGAVENSIQHEPGSTQQLIGTFASAEDIHRQRVLAEPFSELIWRGDEMV